MARVSRHTVAFLLVLAAALFLGGFTGDWSIVTAVAIIGLTLRMTGAVLALAWETPARS